MDAVVLPEGRPDGPTGGIAADGITVAPDAGDPGSSLLPIAVRDALPQLFVETALPLALIDAEGRLLTVNSGFCAIVGRSAAELSRARLGDVIHPDDRIAHVAAWHALLAGIARADRVETRLIRPDGRVVPVVVYRTVVTNGSGRSRAIGLAALHEQTIRLPDGDSTPLSQFTERLAAAHADPAELGAVVARTIAEAVGDGAWLWCVEDDRTLRLLGSWHRDATRRTTLDESLRQQPITAGTGLLASVVGVDRLVRLGAKELEPSTDPVIAMVRSYADRFGLGGVLLIPLHATGRVIGVVGLVRDGGAPAYDDETIERATALAHTAAFGLDSSLAIANARADERFARAVLDAMPVMAAVLDSDGRVIDVNAAWLRAMTQNGGQLHTGIGENYLHLWDTAAATGVIGAAEVAGGVRDVLNGLRDEFAGDCTYPRLDSNGDPIEVWFHIHATQLASTRDDGRPMVVVDHQDITDRKRLEARLSYEATHDPLTRLPNRTLLVDRIEQAIVRDRRAGLRTAVLFCDLDYFKQINDQFGHEGGDEVLRAVARRFGGTVRASDTVARIGGDEFVVLIESVSDLDEALLVADKLVLSLREPTPVAAHGDPPLPGVSVGVAVSNDKSSAETLLRDADAAMYVAKQTGRSRVEAAPS